ncbi:MAG: DMT family transporter [Patescibacteria group bacterium]|nr:MAG: DMT family transporter [Patescibacteria group bacterium]
MTKRILAYLALLTTVIIWGVAGPVIKVTLRDIQPFAFLALRFFINVIIISPILYFYLKKHPIRWGDLPRLSLLTLLGTTISLSLIFLGLERTTVLDAVLIIATVPIFIVAGGALFLKEQVTNLEKAGLVLAFLGVLITILQPVWEGGVFAQENLIGNLFILASNVSWTTFTLLSKKDYQHHSPFLITSASFILGFLAFIPLALIESPSFLTTIYQLPTTAFLGVLYMSLLSSIVAYLTYAWGLSKIEASEAALFLYLEPLFAAPFAYLWLGEAVTTTFLIGAAVIAFGVILTEYRPPHLRRGYGGRARIAHLRHR